MIDHGKLLYDGSVKGMIDKYGKERKLIVEFEFQLQFGKLCTLIEKL